MTLTRCLQVFVAAGALGAALSCAKPESTSPTPGPELQKVRMNLLPIVPYAPAVIAKEEGFFAEEGVDLEFVTMDSNSAMLSMASGAIDVIANPIRSASFSLITRDIPFQIVADDGHFAPGPCPANAFTAPPALAGRIKRDGFRGQPIAMIKGGVTEYVMNRLLAAHDLTTEDVEIVEYPANETGGADLRILDAVRLNFEPLITVQKEKGLIEMILPANDVVPGLPRYALAYGGRLLNDDPALGERFMRGWLRGVRRYNEGKTDRNVEIVSSFTQLSPDLIRKVCWPEIAGDGRVDPEVVQPFVDWMYDRGYMETAVPPSQWWNPTFIDAANRDLAERDGSVPDKTDR